jgi:hypothetical protein
MEDLVIHNKVSRLVGALTILVFAPVVGRAAFVMDSLVSTPTSFTLTGTWTTPDPTTVLTNLGSPDWNISTISFSVSPALGVFTVLAQHTVAPHVGEAPTGSTLSASFSGLAPGVGSGNMSDSGVHSGGSHVDTLAVFITPLVADVSSTVTITANHAVPEPGSLGLAALGLAMVVFFRRKFIVR